MSNEKVKKVAVAFGMFVVFTAALTVAKATLAKVAPKVAEKVNPYL